MTINEFETGPWESPASTSPTLPTDILKAPQLASFDLFAVICKKDTNAFARLYGPTFPHSRLLEEHGAQWDKDNQSWLFQSEGMLRSFADALDCIHHVDDPGLAEETQAFAGALDVSNPLGRFLTHGANAFGNQELLSLLLSFDKYLDNPTATSKSLFNEFGSLGAILGSETIRLTGLNEMTPRAATLLKAVQTTMERVLHEPIQEKLIIGSSQALLDFLRGRLRHRQREESLILYLDSANRLIKVDSHEGTVDHVSLHPREVATRALELFTKAVIIAHNHPGGSGTPSRQDIKTTIQIRRALETLGVDLYDHVIVSDNAHYSFKADGVI